MYVVLNEDIFTLIYSHIFDFNVLCASATAVAINKLHPLKAGIQPRLQRQSWVAAHPLRNVLLRRLLQLSLYLSSENLDDSKALIDFLVREPTAPTDLVRDIAIVLGPSRKFIAERKRFGSKVLPEDLVPAERQKRLWRCFPSY